jgi:hypothetical protein
MMSITPTKGTSIISLPCIDSSKIFGNLGIASGEHAIHHKINTM